MLSALVAVRLVGPHGELDALPGAQLAQEAGHVRLGRAEADLQLVCDLRVRATGGASRPGASDLGSARSMASRPPGPEPGGRRFEDGGVKRFSSL